MENSQLKEFNKNDSLTYMECYGYPYLHYELKTGDN